MKSFATLLAIALIATLARAELSVSINENNRFVLHAEDEPLRALAFRSRADRNLIPATTSAPFQFLGTNSPAAIEYLNRQPITLDGTITLNSGWTGEGAVPEIVFTDFVSGRYTQSTTDLNTEVCTDCPASLLEVSLNDDRRFVLHGNNHVIQSLDFHSDGSLLPAESPAPFESLSSTTAQQISYAAATGGLAIDGSVTLSSGWDVSGTPGDVRYDYVTGNGVENSNLRLPDTAFPTVTIDAMVNDDNQIVLSSNGQSLNSVEFSSRSGSLVPGTSPAPFNTLVTSKPELVSYEQALGNIKIDGEVTLDLGWNPEGEQDVRFRFAGKGNAPDGGYFLSRGDYPSEDGRPEEWISIDEDYRFIFHTSGEKELLGLQILSRENHALLPADSPAPFDAALTNTNQQVAYGSLASRVLVEAGSSVTLDARLNPLLDPSDVQVNFGVGSNVQDVLILPSDLKLCPGCEVPEVAFAANGTLEISGVESELSAITVASESGSLRSLDATAEEFDVLAASDQEVLLAVGEEADIVEAVSLPIAWRNAGSEDVTVSFTTVDGLQIGPFALNASAYDAAVPEPSGLALAGAAIMFFFSWRKRLR